MCLLSRVPRLALLLTLAGSTLPPATATPQDTSPADRPERAPDEADVSDPTTEASETPVFYETTTVTARPVSSATGSVTVIDGEELATSQARSATEVFREVPGFNLLPKDLSGDPLLYEPRWLGGGALTWQPSARVSLRLDARAVSPYLDNQIPVPERDTVPGYGVVGFAGSWTFHRGWSLRGRVDNLADREYETFIGFPGASRSFWLGLGWDRS